MALTMRNNKSAMSTTGYSQRILSPGSQFSNNSIMILAEKAIPKQESPPHKYFQDTSIEAVIEENKLFQQNIRSRYQDRMTRQSSLFNEDFQALVEEKQQRLKKEREREQTEYLNESTTKINDTKLTLTLTCKEGKDFVIQQCEKIVKDMKERMSRVTSEKMELENAIHKNNNDVNRYIEGIKIN